MHQDDEVWDNLVSLFREQKHDFLNHVQVISGYLELNKNDRAVAYIKRIRAEIGALSSITGLENSYLVLILLLVRKRCRSLGVEISFDIEQGAGKDYGCGLFDDFKLVLDTMADFVSRLEEEERWIRVGAQEKFREFSWEFALASSLPGTDLCRILQEMQDRYAYSYRILAENRSEDSTILSLTVLKE